MRESNAELGSRRGGAQLPRPGFVPVARVPPWCQAVCGQQSGPPLQGLVRGRAVSWRPRGLPALPPPGSRPARVLSAAVRM